MRSFGQSVWSLVVVFTVCVATAGCHRHKTDPLAILRENEKAVFGLKNYKADVTVHVTDKDGPDVWKIAVVFERPDHLRIENCMSAGTPRQLNMVIVCDGNQVSRQTGSTYSVRSPEGLDNLISLACCDPFQSTSRSLHAQATNTGSAQITCSNARYMGEMAVDGEPCDMVAFDWSSKVFDQTFTGTSTFGISERDHLVRTRHSDMRWSDGTSMTTDTTIKNIQLDRRLPSDAFVYRPGPGIRKRN